MTIVNDPTIPDNSPTPTAVADLAAKLVAFLETNVAPERGGISAISVYCTGDWDEAQVAAHRQTVKLLRP